MKTLKFIIKGSCISLLTTLFLFGVVLAVVSLYHLLVGESFFVELIESVISFVGSLIMGNFIKFCTEEY